jgi:hypothetical protein
MKSQRKAVRVGVIAIPLAYSIRPSGDIFEATITFSTPETLAIGL